MNDMNENTAAWHKVFTSGSEALKSKLKKTHAKNPKFHAFLKSIGHEGEQKSAAQAKKDVGQINKAKAKAAEPKKVDRIELIKQAAEKRKARAQVAKHRAAWGGEVPGASYDDPVSMARAGRPIRGYRLGEEQTDEALLPKQEKVRKELIDKEMAEKRAKRQAGTAYGRYAALARKMRKMAEEAEQVDERNKENAEAKRRVLRTAGVNASISGKVPFQGSALQMGRTAVNKLSSGAMSKAYRELPRVSEEISEGKVKDIATDREETERLKAQEILGGPVKTKPKNAPAGKHPYGFRRARNLARARLKQLLVQRKGK